MGVAHVGLVHRDPCECKVKGFRAVSSIERNVSKRRHLQGVRQGWCIVTLASARLKASVQFPPLRGMYQRGGTCKGCDKRTLPTLRKFLTGAHIYRKRETQQLQGAKLEIMQICGSLRTIKVKNICTKHAHFIYVRNCSAPNAHAFLTKYI